MAKRVTSTVTVTVEKKKKKIVFHTIIRHFKRKSSGTIRIELGYYPYKAEVPSH